MALGPGKYDPEASQARGATGAAAVVLMVLGGDRGSGFSVVASYDITDQLPGLLRSMADQIEADL